MSFISILLAALLGFCYYSCTDGFPQTELSRYEMSNNSSCHCVNYNCGCCSHLDIPKIKLNNTVCVNITYLPEDYGISLTFSIDGKVYFNDTVSARNPPPICFGVPYLEKHAAICIHFYDLDIEKHKFHGCIKLEAHLEHFVIGQYDLGCFNFGFHLSQQIGLHGKDKEKCECGTTLQCSCCKQYFVDAVHKKPVCVVSQFLTGEHKMNISVTLNNEIIGHALLPDSGLFMKCFGFISEQEKTICLQYNFIAQNNIYSVCINLSIHSNEQIDIVFNHTCFYFSDTWHSIYDTFKKLVDKNNKYGNASIKRDELETYNKIIQIIPFSTIENHNGPEYLQASNFDFKCQCKSKICSCCGTFVIEILHIQGSLCVSVQYLYNINSIYTRVVYSNHLVMEVTVPAAPSPAIMLFKIPSLPAVMDLGLSFSDVFISSQSCQLCMNLWLAVNHYAVGGMKIGCVNAPRMFNNHSLLED